MYLGNLSKVLSKYHIKLSQGYHSQLATQVHRLLDMGRHVSYMYYSTTPKVGFVLSLVFMVQHQLSLKTLHMISCFPLFLKLVSTQ